MLNLPFFIGEGNFILSLFSFKNTFGERNVSFFGLKNTFGEGNTFSFFDFKIILGEGNVEHIPIC